MLGVRSSLVRAHMLREDIPAAMEAFEKGSKEFKILPAKLEFTKKLIEEENVDGLQKIVGKNTPGLGGGGGEFLKKKKKKN